MDLGASLAYGVRLGWAEPKAGEIEPWQWFEKHSEAFQKYGCDEDIYGGEWGQGHMIIVKDIGVSGGYCDEVDFPYHTPEEMADAERRIRALLKEVGLHPCGDLERALGETDDQQVPWTCEGAKLEPHWMISGYTY